MSHPVKIYRKGCFNAYKFIALCTKTIKMAESNILSSLAPVAAAINPIAGAAVGVAGALMGGIEAGRERKRMQSYLDTGNNENTAWYNTNANRNYTERSDVQNLMRTVREGMKRRDTVNASRAAITGATPEAQAASKAATAQSLGDVYGRVAALGQNWKDRITDQYLRRKDAFRNANMGIAEGNASSYENLMYNGINQLGSTAGSLASQLLQPKAIASGVSTGTPSEARATWVGVPPTEVQGVGGSNVLLPGQVKEAPNFNQYNRAD